MEVVEPSWLKEMVGCFDYPEVGIVGAKLVYPDGTLQHAGVIAGLGGYAGHWHIGRPGPFLGPQRRLAARQSLSVVTGACMLVSRACFASVGGFDEATFPIAYNDVDFCLRAGAAGFRVVWTPFARLIHHKSASRGSDETEENLARFDRDKAALRARHGTDTLEDRAYNPWAARHEFRACARPSREPAARTCVTGEGSLARPGPRIPPERARRHETECSTFSTVIASAAIQPFRDALVCLHHVLAQPVRLCLIQRRLGPSSVAGAHACDRREVWFRPSTYSPL